MKTEFQILKADHGDCILIKTINLCGELFTILIDGGTARTYDNVLKNELKKIKKIDLLVLTHIDSDHIKGLIKFINDSLFEDIIVEKYWINSKNIPFLLQGTNISYGQAISIEKLLIDKDEITDKWSENIITDKIISLSEGITAEIISPTQEILDQLFSKWPELPNEYYAEPRNINISSSRISEVEQISLQELAILPFDPDKSIFSDIFNSSSIAFVLKMVDYNLLLLGDARPEIYMKGLEAHGYSTANKLEVRYVKLSHHGSMNNTTVDLLEYLSCENFIISTNGGLSGHCLPDRETIARIIHNPSRVETGYLEKRVVYFNYPIDNIKLKAGEFINDSDFEVGNWGIIDNKNSF